MATEEVTFVEESVDDHHECLVCLQILKEPCIIECCGHHMCKPCIDQLVSSSNECPHCRSVGINFVRDRHLERILMGKQVYCKYKSRGCEWQGTLREADQHCSTVRHCEWCQMMLTCYEERQHVGGCTMANEIVECELELFGCSGKVPRMKMKLHMEENHQEHVDLLKEAVKISNAEVADLRNDNSQLKEENQRLQTEKAILVNKIMLKVYELREASQSLIEENDLICEEKETEIKRLMAQIESCGQDNGNGIGNEECLMATLLDNVQRLNKAKVALRADNIQNLEKERMSLQIKVNRYHGGLVAGVVIGLISLLISFLSIYFPKLIADVFHLTVLGGMIIAFYVHLCYNINWILNREFVSVVVIPIIFFSSVTVLLLHKF